MRSGEWYIRGLHDNVGGKCKGRKTSCNKENGNGEDVFFHSEIQQIESPGTEVPGPSSSEQLLHRLRVEIRQRDGAVLRAGQFLVGIETQGLVQRGGHFGGGDGPRFGNVAKLVRLADHTAALDR